MTQGGYDHSAVAAFTRIAMLVALALGATLVPAQAQSAQRGLALARTHCAKCHAIDKVGPSPLAIAPAFRELHKRYPVERLEEALAEGVVTGHPAMPEVRFNAGQIGDFIAYLKTLE